MLVSGGFRGWMSWSISLVGKEIDSMIMMKRLTMTKATITGTKVRAIPIKATLDLDLD